MALRRERFSLKGKMPAKPRRIVSAQGEGRHSKSLCDSNFTMHSTSGDSVNLLRRSTFSTAGPFGALLVNP